MKIELENPYLKDWECGYLVVNSENRKHVILTRNNSSEKSSTSYARYLLSVSLGRYLTADEHADHIDNDKTNDVPQNLQILSQQEHTKKHHNEHRTPPEHGTYSRYRALKCRCEACCAANKDMQNRSYLLHREARNARRREKRQLEKNP